MIVRALGTALIATAAVVVADGRDPAGARFEQGLKLFIAEEYKEAQRAFEEAARDRPDDPESWLWLGRTYGRRAERASGFAIFGALSTAKKARSSFERALEADPRHLPALEALLDFHLEAPGIVGGDRERAPALAERIAEVDPAAGRRAWARVHERREHFSKAEESLRHAVEMEPDSVDHRLSLAAFLARRGRFEESDRLYVELLAEHPDSPRVWYSRADALVRAKRRPDEARRLLERYLNSPLYAPDAEPRSDARRLLKRL